MTISIRNIIRLNALLVLAIGIYGFLTDEPYWSDVGHGPWLYDYFFWCVLALNGPSGFAADYVSRFITDKWIHSIDADDWQFLVQYGFWLLLLWVQWRGYHAIVTWCIGRRSREISLYVVTAAITVIGSVAAYQAWIYGHRPMEFIDYYFWFVRIAGIALSGMILLGYFQFAKKKNASAKAVPSPFSSKL